MRCLAVFAVLLSMSGALGQEFGSIQGRAYDEEADRPIVGALVVAVPFGAKAGHFSGDRLFEEDILRLFQITAGRVPLIARTAADGSFVLSDVPPGEYDVRLADPEVGLPAPSARVSVVAGGTAGLAELRRTRLRAGQLLITLRDPDGAPMPNQRLRDLLRVETRMPQGGRQTSMQSGYQPTTDDLGRLYLDVRLTGAAELLVIVDGHAPWYREFELSVEGQEIEVRLSREAGEPVVGSIAGLVTDAAGRPVRGAKLWLRRLRGDDQEMTVHQESYTDDDGQYNLDALLPGTYQLTVDPVVAWTRPVNPALVELAPAELTGVAVVAGETTSAPAAVMPPGAQLEVSVVDDVTGDLIRGAKVSMGNTGRPSGHYNGETDGFGTLHAFGLYPSPCRVTVERFGYAKKTVELVLRAGANGVVVSLSREQPPG